MSGSVDPKGHGLPHIKLFDKHHHYVATVLVPEIGKTFGVIVWGNRVFSLQTGSYKEVESFFATEQVREPFES